MAKRKKRIKGVKFKIRNKSIKKTPSQVKKDFEIYAGGVDRLTKRVKIRARNNIIGMEKQQKLNISQNCKPRERLLAT